MRWLPLVAVAYAAAVLWIDRDRPILRGLSQLAAPMALATLPVLLSFAARYHRWRGLLRAGAEPFGWWRGACAYLAGFALTATPGKAGELIRIRYFTDLGVAPHATFATFVFERALDLLVILTMSLLVAQRFTGFDVLVWIVLVAVGSLLVLARWRRLLMWFDSMATRLPGRWLRAAAGFACAGLSAMGTSVRPRPLGIGIGWGVVAWTLTSLAFAGLCIAMGLSLPLHALVGIYPLAMLVGALSFVPGGVGTTEAAIVLLLRQFGVGITEAITLAVAIRLATLWFAVLVGMAALLLCEARGNDGAAVAPG